MGPLGGCPGSPRARRPLPGKPKGRWPAGSRARDSETSQAVFADTFPVSKSVHATAFINRQRGCKEGLIVPLRGVGAAAWGGSAREHTSDVGARQALTDSRLAPSRLGELGRVLFFSRPNSPVPR